MGQTTQNKPKISTALLNTVNILRRVVTKVLQLWEHYPVHRPTKCGIRSHSLGLSFEVKKYVFCPLKKGFQNVQTCF